MNKNKETNNNGRLKGVEAALRRAGLRAREIAAATGTPLVIFVDGKIKKIWFCSKRTIRPTK